MNSFSFLHVGLPKAGSTFLQSNVFPIIFPEVTLRHRGGVKALKEIKECFLAKGVIPRYDTLGFISAEGLTHLQRPVYNPGDAWSSFLALISALQRQQAPIKILFVIRRHEDWLRSEYIDRMKKGKRTGGFDGFVNSWTKDDMSWYKRVEMLSAWPLLVISQSDLAAFPIPTVRMIGEFCERPVTQQLVDRILVQRGRANVNPRSVLSLLSTRIAFASARRIKKTFSCIPLDPYSFRDSVARVMNLVPSRNLRDSLVTPPEWVDFFQEDWERTAPYITRPTEACATMGDGGGAP